MKIDNVYLWVLYEKKKHFKMEKRRYLPPGCSDKA